MVLDPNKINLGVNIDPHVYELEEILRIAKIADANSIDIIGIQDHPYVGFFFDTWTLISYLASQTSKVTFMTNVANLPLRTPQIIAKSFATLDILTKGRIELGIGAGANWDAIEAYGGPRRSIKEGIEALEEGINVIRMLWSINAKTKVVSYNGKYYSLKNAYPGPKPFHDIKIIIGANGPKMLNLTGKLGDGWSISMFYFLPEEVRVKKKMLEEACRKYGRDFNELIKIYNIAGMITRERTGIQINEDNLLIANYEEWAEFIIKIHKKLGMNTFIFWPTTKNKSDQVKIFSEKVKGVIESK
jgi:alkanesulfonate monooxygenase SsuD/methylene tetrahydromethanopterin reductase-like flavin-dependent oxidoreductase (luciferase family)